MAALGREIFCPHPDKHLTMVAGLKEGFQAPVPVVRLMREAWKHGTAAGSDNSVPTFFNPLSRNTAWTQK